jgi:hypothetical protein
VSAIAQHVSPVAEPTVGGFPVLGVFVVGTVSQGPAGDDQAGGVGGQGAVIVNGVGGDAGGEVAGGFGGFGGVFGQIARRGDVGEFPGETDRSNVELGAPGDQPAAGLAGMGWGGEGCGCCGGGDEVVEIGDGDCWGGGRTSSGWVGSMASRQIKAARSCRERTMAP